MSECKVRVGSVNTIQRNGARNSLTAILAMNVLDAAFTWYFVSTGIGYEVNPLMNFLISFGWEWFFFGKLIMVSASVMILWENREMKMAIYGRRFLFWSYVVLIIYHLLLLFSAFFWI